MDKIDKAEEDDKREAKNRLREQEYENFMLLGDKNYKSGLYQQAKEAYEKAENIKPNDRAATTKISESVSQIQRLTKDLEDKQKETAYNLKLAMAKKSEEAGNYNNAIAALNEAHDIKHEETFTKGEISRINSLVNGVAIKEKLDKEKQKTEEEYSLLIAGADEAFKAADYAKAKAGYLQAKNKIKNRTYPDEKIALIAKVLQQQQEDPGWSDHYETEAPPPNYDEYYSGHSNRSAVKEPASPWNSASNRMLMTPAQKAVALLVATPSLAALETDHDTWLEHSDTDLQMLGRLLKVLHERPHYNLSHLIGYWRGIFGAEATEQLAKIAGSDLLQAANALTVTRDDKAAKADYDSEAAFLGCMEGLKLAQQKQAILASQTVAHQTEFSQLTDEQKAQIKASLRRKE